MANESSVVKWYIVFDILAKALVEHYNKCTKEGLDPGHELYKRLLEDSGFREHHTWIRKFDQKWGVKSIDPIHLFASFNNGRSPDKNRTIRIRDIYNALDIQFSFKEIDFEGCPAPQTLAILSVRKIDVQSKIWAFFQRIYINGFTELVDVDFANYKSWYGIEIASFTIFLYWIRSDEFMPIDRNTATFIVSTGIVQYSPIDFYSYQKFMQEISPYNVGYNLHDYGRNGLFREITHLSYKVVNLGIEVNTYSNILNDLIQTLASSDNNDISDDTNAPVQGADENSKLARLGLKIIAIKPLLNCDRKFLNILKPGQVYQFENTITIEGDVIKYNPDKVISFYDIRPNEKDHLKINVTAVVGKNGSGKSSLIELFFRIINNVAFLHKDELKTEDLEFVPGLEAELFYLSKGRLHSVETLRDIVTIQDYNLLGTTFEKDGEKRNFSFEDFKNWFYTIAVNYSIYPLNSLHLGDWIKRLFHKNDSYQTPLVINPMRTKGTININIENELVKYRLLANLMAPIPEKEPDEDLQDIGIRQITEKQKATKVEFKFIPEKNKTIYSYYDDKEIEHSVPYVDINTTEKDILELVAECFGFSIESLPQSILIEETKKYIIRKLIKTATYSQYSIYEDSISILYKDKLDKSFVPSYKENEQSLTNYINALKDDSSHITYKLKQAINYIKYIDLFDKLEQFTINLESDTVRLENYISTNDLGDIDRIELIPPPIFKPKIILKNIIDEESDFELLSSGEKQRIHTISSILYHIKNLNSVESKKSKLVSYSDVNLLLDEIELYYHPEMQREYLSFLIKMLSKLTLGNIESINICFVTHSPFILSDIPNEYILFLNEEGYPKKDAINFKTFGANIHDLLKHSFFLDKDGYMGDFAKNKIISAVDYLVKSKKAKEKKTSFEDPIWDKVKVVEFINLIGEPLIQKSMMDMYREIFPKNKEELQKEIDELVNLRDSLN